MKLLIIAFVIFCFGCQKAAILGVDPNMQDEELMRTIREVGYLNTLIKCGDTIIWYSDSWGPGCTAVTVPDCKWVGFVLKRMDSLNIKQN